MSALTPFKLAFLNNLITPYRVPLYRGLGEHFSLYLLLSGQESNRDTWQGLEKNLSNISIQKVWGFTLRFFEKRKGKAFDPRYLHINPGYLYELLKIRPDAIISSEMGFRSLVALFYGVVFRKPVWILWGGTLLTEKNRNRIKKWLRRLVFSRVTRWISYGETTTEYLIEGLKIKRSHILQIQNCIDETHFTNPLTQPLVSCSPAPVLLYTGQLIQRKGVDVFLKAAAKIQQQGYSFSILIVGSGREKEALARLAADLGLKNVTVLPAQSPEDMPAVYKSADVLVFPTLEEVWGLVVNEALWSGLTVISSMYAGCAREIVPHDNIFDPLDINSVVSVLTKAIEKQLPPPTVDCLMTASAVVEMISAEITNELLRDAHKKFEKTLSTSM